MYKSSIIVTISNEYALTENFFNNLLLIIKDDINVFAVVDGATDTQTVSFLQRLQEQNDNISVTFNNDAGKEKFTCGSDAVWRRKPNVCSAIGGRLPRLR